MQQISTQIRFALPVWFEGKKGGGLIRFTLYKWYGKLCKLRITYWQSHNELNYVAWFPVSVNVNASDNSHRNTLLVDTKFTITCSILQLSPLSISSRDLVACGAVWWCDSFLISRLLSFVCKNFYGYFRERPNHIAFSRRECNNIPSIHRKRKNLFPDISAISSTIESDNRVKVKLSLCSPKLSTTPW